MFSRRIQCGDKKKKKKMVGIDAEDFMQRKLASNQSAKGQSP